MTTPTPAGGQSSPGASLPIRSLTAWALLALAAVVVFFAFLSTVFPPFERDFVDRFSVGSFANTTVIVAPLLAMLVATCTGPVLSGAKLMGLIGLATYAAALVFGAISFLVTIADEFDVGGRGALYAFGGVLDGFGDLIVHLLLLALLALAGLWTFKIFTGLGGKLPSANVQTD